MGVVLNLKDIRRFCEEFSGGNEFCGERGRIGLFLGFSNVSVLKRIREFGEKLSDITNDEPVRTIELDEMHTSIGQKKLLLDMDCR